MTSPIVVATPGGIVPQFAGPLTVGSGAQLQQLAPCPLSTNSLRLTGFGSCRFTGWTTAAIAAENLPHGTALCRLGSPSWVKQNCKALKEREE